MPPDTHTHDNEKEVNQSNIKQTDKKYFAVNGVLIAQSGKSFKARLNKDLGEGGDLTDYS